MARGAYRLLGYEHVRLSYKELALLVREGLLPGDTKVIRHGEGFAAALGCRAEFRQFLVRPPAGRGSP
jgi:hypothetical protein